MKLHELLAQLELARAQGAEDNATVHFDLRRDQLLNVEDTDLTSSEIRALNRDAILATIIADEPLHSVTFERNGRHEIVLR